MPTSPTALIVLALGLAICLLACWKGGPAERLGALLILINTVAFIGAGYVLPKSTLTILLLADDALTALGLLAITLRYGSLWLGGCMLFYAAQFTLHSYYFVTERPSDGFHAIVNNINFLGMILCLAVGTAATWRKRMGQAAA